MPRCRQADAVLMACKKEKRQPTEKEAKLLAEAEAVRDKLIQVRPSARPPVRSFYFPSPTHAFSVLFELHSFPC